RRVSGRPTEPRDDDAQAGEPETRAEVEEAREQPRVGRVEQQPGRRGTQPEQQRRDQREDDRAHHAFTLLSARSNQYVIPISRYTAVAAATCWSDSERRPMRRCSVPRPARQWATSGRMPSSFASARLLL